MKSFLPLIALVLLFLAIYARDEISKALRPATSEAPIAIPIEKPREIPIAKPEKIPTHGGSASTPVHTLTCEAREMPQLNCLEEALAHEARVEILRAIDLYKSICEKGGGDGCYRLALIYRDRGDSGKMLQFYEKGCALSQPTSCFNKNLLKKALDKVRLFDSKNTSCERVSLQTCHNIGTLNRELGQLAPAIQNLVPACQGGIGESCLALAEIARASESPSEAKLRYQKACDLKLTDACEALKAL